MGKDKNLLLKSTFVTDHRLQNPQPDELLACAGGIQITAWRGENEKHEVFLSPCHIEAIVAMHADWWEDHWAELHEQQV